VKIACILCGVYLCALLAGCTVAESSTSDVSEQFQRGIQGQGTIVPNNPTGDSFGPDYR
jgi:hypothetical protein